MSGKPPRKLEWQLVLPLVGFLSSLVVLTIVLVEAPVYSLPAFVLALVFLPLGAAIGIRFDRTRTDFLDAEEEAGAEEEG